MIWLKENNYITITYALHRTGVESTNFLDHLVLPLIFLIKQIGILIPFWVMLFLIISKIKIKINFKDKKILFLFFTCIVPVILVFITSSVMGAKIKTMWMTPFYLFFGVFFIYLLQDQIVLKKLKFFFIFFILFFILSPTIYSIISLSQDKKRTDYPGKKIANEVQILWDKNFISEISIIVGDEWQAGNLSYHLKSRPKWFHHDNSPDKLDLNQGIIYTGDKYAIKKSCLGIFKLLNNQAVCMMGKNK